MRFTATLKGGGVATIAAYGSADAEATVEKELRRAIPDARIRILGIRRAQDESHIVEEFLVEYTVLLDAEAEGHDEADARKALMASIRAALKGGRFEKIAWESAVFRSVREG